MNEQIEKLIEGKRAMRTKLADLPFDQKIEILEQLRERTLFIESSPLKQKYAGGKSKIQPAKFDASKTTNY